MRLVPAENFKNTCVLFRVFLIEKPQIMVEYDIVLNISNAILKNPKYIKMLFFIGKNWT